MPSPSTAPSSDAAVLSNATEALYRAALGPGGTAHYLRVFGHFDERGLGAASWNHAAAWLNLSWLLYRRLWRMAGLYALLLGLALGLWWWACAPLANRSPGVYWGLLALIGVLAVAVPGCWGSAWLHSALRTRMTEAVRRAHTVQEACDALRRVGPTRWVWLPAVLLQAAAVLALWPVGFGSARVEAPLAVAPEPLPVPAPVPAPAVVAQVPAPKPEPPEQTEPRSAVALADEPALPLPRPVEAAPATLSPVRTVAEPAPVSDPAPAPVKPAAVKPAPVPQPPAPRPPAKLPVASPERAADTARPRWQGHGVNVGIFGEAANAQRAASRLRQRGLPVQTDAVESARGPLTRVRVGPFAQRDQAEAAAKTARELGLEAKVFGP